MVNQLAMFNSSSSPSNKTKPDPTSDELNPYPPKIIKIIKN
jgi:hypothetical protein